ncbi:nuclear transport factor 2 family protein [Rhodococcus rhodochrous]|uniref:Nuclear transport factor 2 family protein n=1 Tax=Rhodococcus rhodochrous TaxID=1829 RepID=A0AAW4XN47_RHORH|nr:nuclear transport factor 2 family protein [Rhodococcus rhodochrous]MCD2114646.1 nuclear transport factor 2 family protein [Rhodococcus rhodochrous]
MSTTQDVTERLARVVDDLEIRRAITDYATLVDAQDWTRLAAIFDDDVVVEYHNGRTTVKGAKAVADYVQANTSHVAWQHHMVSPYGIDIDGDSATALAYLVSHQQVRGDDTEFLMMAADYTLELARREQGWVITRMVHTIKVASFLPISSAPITGAEVPAAVRH